MTRSWLRIGRRRRGEAIRRPPAYHLAAGRATGSGRSAGATRVGAAARAVRGVSAYRDLAASCTV